MSWIATKYAWKCTHPQVKGSVRLVLLAVALRVRKNCCTTQPTQLRTFERLTLLDARQIRRCLMTLNTVGEVRRLNRGKRAIYALERMTGPLFAVSLEEADKMSAFTEPLRRRKTDKMTAFDPDKMSAKKGTTCPVSAGGVLSLDLSTTKDLRTTTAPEAAAADAFLDWFLSEYPKHRRGVLYVVDPRVAEPIVRELLAGRSIERLQQMARAMWQEADDAWILKSDYSLHVLRHRAAQLENAVAGREQDRLTPFEQARRLGYK